MALEDKTLKLCNCNKTIPIDAAELSRALKLGASPRVHTELCRKEVASFTAALKDEACIVGCTQEAALFSELAEQAESGTALRFVNLRELAGWSAEGAAAMPKIAALLAQAGVPEPEPVAAVSYSSGGQLLIIGPAASALDWAERLSAELEVSVLMTRTRGAELPANRRFPAKS